MVATVAIVKKNSFANAINQIGGIVDLNEKGKTIVIKVGIYNPENKNCTTVNTLSQMIKSFDKATDIKIVESDSGAGPGLKRLEIWKECYEDNITPFNISDDKNLTNVNVSSETVPFSQVLFKPNVFISTHVPRRYEGTGTEDLLSMGSIIKNLLGLILDTKKHRFHKQLPIALLDMYEAIGGIDLAVLDGTHAYLGREKERAIVNPDILIVGRDAFAVETVGFHIVGINPKENPVLQEAKKRGLGETDLTKIKIIGDIETPRKLVLEAFNQL